MLIVLQSAAGVIHHSFRTREAGFGFGTGEATVAYPVDSKVAAALDEAEEKDAARTAAKEKKLGLWASENPINPYVWRKRKM